MKNRWTLVGCLLVVVLTAVALVGSAGTSSSLLGTRFKAGQEIQFVVKDTTTWWWGCCSCTETLVLGWRVTNSTGVTVYSVVHDAGVPASAWQGTWLQMDGAGNVVPAGEYMLYVDTSAGTLSRCFRIYDPCGCYNNYLCNTCGCQDNATITNCACKTSLEFVDTCSFGCLSFFWWLNPCCGSPCSSPCSSCP